jgi:hypothetical protein
VSRQELHEVALDLIRLVGLRQPEPLRHARMCRSTMTPPAIPNACVSTTFAVLGPRPNGNFAD